jgi:integrase
MVPDWRPNQLRHRAATMASESMDRSHAAAFLGHAGLDTIGVYVEQEMVKAALTWTEAGGTGEIVVKGHGNTTHPVCSVSVAKARK